MRIKLETKLALIAIVLYNSTEPEQMEYVDDTNLTPPYHLTPETEKQLKDNGLIDDLNYPTKKGVWFANVGTSDTPPAFIDFCRNLSINALQSLMYYVVGSFVKRHRTTSNTETKLKIERILRQFTEFYLGDPNNPKSIEQLEKDYDKVEQYNQSKYN